MPRRTMDFVTLAVVSVLVAPLVLLEARQSQPTKDKWPKEIKNSIGMKLVRIPPTKETYKDKGTFTMGSPRSEKDRNKDEEQHEVEITKAFYLGVHEVTQKQFRAVMGYNPSYFSKNAESKGREGIKYDLEPGGGKDRIPKEDHSTDDFPVENVSHEEAEEFCKKLTALAARKGEKRVYRLPREAEWEYACRGGASSYQIFHFGNSLSSKQANIDGDYPSGEAGKGDPLKRTCKVGHVGAAKYEKNGFGLYDMHGNVYEWCADRYGSDYYATSPRRDPAGPSKGPVRVIRGGSWNRDGRRSRSADRFRFTPTNRYYHLGFRVALVPSSQ